MLHRQSEPATRTRTASGVTSLVCLYHMLLRNPDPEAHRRSLSVESSYMDCLIVLSGLYTPLTTRLESARLAWKDLATATGGISPPYPSG